MPTLRRCPVHVGRPCLSRLRAQLLHRRPPNPDEPSTSAPSWVCRASDYSGYAEAVVRIHRANRQQQQLTNRTPKAPRDGDAASSAPVPSPPRTALPGVPPAPSRLRPSSKARPVGVALYQKKLTARIKQTLDFAEVGATCTLFAWESWHAWSPDHRILVAAANSRRHQILVR